MPGAVLLIAPQVIAPLWPWELTPLTGRAIGAWFVGLSVVPIQMRLEDDWCRLRPAVLSSIAFVALQAMAIARFWSAADWSKALGVLLLAILVSMVIVAVVGSPRAFAGERGAQPRVSDAEA